MKTRRNPAERLLRNTKALLRRLARSIRHRDADGIVRASLLLAENAGWAFCLACALALAVAGLFKPHCFAMALLYLFLAGIVRADIEENRKGLPYYEVDK